MKILTLSTNDLTGGAARASYNLFKSLGKLGIESRMLVSSKYSSDNDVIGPVTKFSKLMAIFAMYLDLLPTKLLKTSNTNLHSPAWCSSGSLKKIHKTNPDIVHLHWVQRGFLSVRAISKIKPPIVWTLHDMWAFCGAEHYSDGSERYKVGYSQKTRDSRESGLDLNRWVWKRKIKYFKTIENLTIVTPSKWMARCAAESILLKNRPIHVIPVGVNHNLFRPRDKKTVREILELPLDKEIILIGAMDFFNDKRKGGHLLPSTFSKMSDLGLEDAVEIVILGSSGPKNSINFGYPTHYFGAGRDDLSMALLYSAR